jgi:predicted permease
VVVELATAVVLLVAAGLFAKSFYRLLQVDPGLQAHNLALLNLYAPYQHYSNNEQQILLEREILHRVSALPGISSAAITSRLPVGDGDNTSWFVILGHEHPGRHDEVAVRNVTTSYFKALGARLLQGRDFADFDQDPTHPHVAIINRALARKYFVGLNPIGMRINFEDGKPEQAMQVVGIVNDVREGTLDTEARCAFYYPFENNPSTLFSVVARTSLPAEDAAPIISSAIHQIDPFIATYGVSTMDQRIRDSQPEYLHRASSWLVGTFAAVALLLSVVGLYGVVAYSVSQRTREIGVRMALGAQRGEVYQLVMKEAGWLIGTGLVAGLVGSLCAASLIRSLLFGTRPWDAATLASVALALAGSALAASYLPAHRAASVNPVEALRAE